MRRIVERVVTVVTTTTWKISWEPDLPHSNPAADSASENLPYADELTETAQSAQTISPAIEVKEDDLWVKKPVNTQTTDNLPEDSDSHERKKGNRKS